MRLHLILLLLETTFASYSSAELRKLKLYFKGPFLDNLDKIVDITTEILSDDRSLGKLKMTDLDDTDNSEDLRKQTAAILKTALAKDFLRENLRDLQLDNTLRKERLAAVVNSLPDTDLVDTYKNYTRQLEEIEKRLLELFSPNGEVQKRDLYTNLDYTAETLFEQIIKLLGEKSLVRRVLVLNKYTDAIFLNFYHIFRNHAMLLSIASTASSNLRNVTAPSKRNRIETLTSALTMQYGKVLVAAKAVNAWRDASGFQFDDLFSEDQLNNLQNYYAVPHPDHLNQFIFNAATESMKSKYYYFAMKNCDNRLDKYQHPAVTAIERLPRFTCDSWVFRYPLEKAPNNTNSVAIARKFKKQAASVLKGAKNYNELSAAKLIYDSMNQNEDVGLLTVATTRNPGSIIDDIHSVPGGFKVVLDFDVTQSAYTEKNIVRLQVIGYFITRHDL